MLKIKTFINFIGLCFISFSPSIYAVSEKGNEDFPMSHMTWSATLLEVKGADSADATAIGKVLRLNATEYCKRDPGGETGGTKAGITKCIESLLAEEKGKLYSISANCIKKIITTSHLGSFTFTGRFENAEGFPVYPWKNENTGEMLDGGMASGGATVDAQFATVCPSFKTW